ncbi:hypothetical protein [Azospirillum sp.]|uniref:hypothetical protein n=1 Tax=Azospirillum sp. TaxID=34012 RepID=UPI0026354C19|nr:hypothetical protein [Azospirillum sp.]
MNDYNLGCVTIFSHGGTIALNSDGKRLESCGFVSSLGISRIERRGGCPVLLVAGVRGGRLRVSNLRFFSYFVYKVKQKSQKKKLCPKYAFHMGTNEQNRFLEKVQARGNARNDDPIIHEMSHQERTRCLRRPLPP